VALPLFNYQHQRQPAHSWLKGPNQPCKVSALGVWIELNLVVSVYNILYRNVWWWYLGKILTAVFVIILMWFGNFLWGYYIGQTGAMQRHVTRIRRNRADGYAYWAGFCGYWNGQIRNDDKQKNRGNKNRGKQQPVCHNAWGRASSAGQGNTTSSKLGWTVDNQRYSSSDCSLVACWTDILRVSENISSFCRLSRVLLYSSLTCLPTWQGRWTASKECTKAVKLFKKYSNLSLYMQESREEALGYVHR
jgi:hypothetical protein